MFPLFNLCLCLTLNDPKQYRCLSVSNAGPKGYQVIFGYHHSLGKYEDYISWAWCISGVGFLPRQLKYQSKQAAGLLVFLWRRWLGKFEGGKKVSFLSIIGAVMLVSRCVLERRPYYWYRPDTTLSWLASQVCLHDNSPLSAWDK